MSQKCTGTDGMRLRLVIMGVSASGKTSVGRAIGRALDVPFIDADDLHPRENIEKMSSGEPLGDVERMPWLSAVGAQMLHHPAVVVACSALKRSYRDIIRSHAPDAFFVHLDVSYTLLLKRLSQRQGHFMPVSLLESQLNDLERIENEERAVVLDGEQPQEQLIEDICRLLASVFHDTGA